MSVRARGRRACPHETPFRDWDRVATMNPFGHIRRLCPSFTPGCIFDIGANVGQTIRHAREFWPDAPIHAFEPVAATFALLEAKTGGDPALTRHRLAFGTRAGRAVMLAVPGSETNRILDRARPNQPTEEVEVVTGDGFCAAHGIDRIGVLKVDTEGCDLDVLVGFRNLLADRRAEFVVVEAGMLPDSPLHVPFGRLADLLLAFGYG